MDEELECFLKKREISNLAIDLMKTEKIDCHAILMMGDEQLSKYIPLYGDRLAVKEFCRFEEPLPKMKTRSSTLMERLRKNIKILSNPVTRSKTSEESSSQRHTKNKGNKSAEKKSRKIELSCYHYLQTNNTYKQIRKNYGGGTREIEVPKSTTMDELLKKASNLYFVGGTSHRGLQTDFEVKLADINFCDVKPDATVEEYYDREKMRILRFNFITSCAEPKKTAKDADTSPTEDLSCTRNSRKSVSAIRCAEVENMEKYYMIPSELKSKENTDMIAGEINKKDKLLSAEVESDEETIFVLNSEDKTIPVQENDIVAMALQESLISENDVKTSSPPASFQTLYSNHDNMSVDEEVTFGPLLSYDTSSQDSTIPLHGSNENYLHEIFVQSDERSPYLINIHRSNIFLELMNCFKNPEVLTSPVEVKMILPNGMEEQGEGSGVFRDCLTEWWGHFYDQCTLGSDLKVPLIRHDMQKEEWLAVGRIIKKGYTEFGYFPVKLSPIVMEFSIYGEFKSSLKENFLSFLSPCERDTILSSLAKFPEEADELLDVLDTYGCRTIPTKENLHALILELGHKELIQKPKYIIDCFSEVLKDLHHTLLPEDLEMMFSSLQPSVKGVLSRLKYPSDLDAESRTSTKYLRQYVKELDAGKLKLFLRFCTGADLLLPKLESISVEITEMTGLNRRPIAHTCGCVLKLSNNYENFPTFRTEFNHVLMSDIWVMDIV